MSNPIPAGANRWSWREEFTAAVDALKIKESKARFEDLGRVLYTMWPDVIIFARDVTSHSAPEMAVYKEGAESTVVWHHHPLDHFGEPHGSDACLALEAGDAEVPAVEASEDDL